jgi:metallophosphoesterase superfamily enzyme
MIEKIAHLGDIHIRKTPTRNEEYQLVFDRLIKSLEVYKPDRIVIVGDLNHDYIDIQGEHLILASEFLNSLSKIAPVRITRGNHDCRKKNLNRTDSIKAIVETLHNPNVKYYDETGFYYDENIAWAVWHHGESKNNPWKTKVGKENLRIKEEGTEKITIDLFHDPVSGCKSTTGFEMKSKSYYKIGDFKGDYSFFGDIHKMQFLDKKHTKAYCGSLIAQDVSEGDDNFHGFLLWNIKDGSVEEIQIPNDWSYKNILISQYTDFDDLDFEIQNPTDHMKIRFIWNTLPQTRTKEAERKLAEYVKGKYPKDSIQTISQANNFIETDKIDINENVTLENISDKGVQHEIFKEYLSKIGIEDKVITDVIALDEEILKEIEITDDQSIEWNVVKFGGKNFMSYETLDIDWRDKDGLFQIVGENTAGKTTIMKILTYILFGKALETETRVKYGDMRFVNNRNGAKSCEAYLIIEANGEYFGIKKKTEITRTKGGEINGAPTTLSYFALSNPDEEMDDNTSLEKLDEDRRAKTQQKIEAIIGSYDNFMRIVMTTSDTLNRILSNDMAIFIDSLLFDSGLDIFDKKLEGWKIVNKRINEKSRITCDVDGVTLQNTVLRQEIQTLENEVVNIEDVILPDIQKRILTGRKYVEDLTKKLFKIDPEIYTLNTEDTNEEITTHELSIDDLNAREAVLKQSIIPLKQSYDVDRLNVLIQKKDSHKIVEYNKKLQVKALEQIVRDEEHAIEIINGDIFRAKQKGADYKKQIQELKESKTCSQCGQLLTAEHQVHITEKIKSIEALMFPLGTDIKKWDGEDKKVHLDKIIEKKGEIGHIRVDIEAHSLEMEDILKEIGTITNEKNDVEKRAQLQAELDQIPTKILNEELQITILQQKIDNYDNSLLQIEENQNIEKGIAAAKVKITTLETEESNEKELILIKKTSIGDKELKIRTSEQLIKDFKAQEYRDLVMGLYKKCVHRDGIPRQMLANYILPKINITLEKILAVAPFKVWLDPDDLRPKLAYNNRPTSVIDCISASGKERTFSSIVLKFALNQINVKAKPSIFLLDEIMGKLLNDSVEEFIEILQLIKGGMKKVLVIEPKEEINPDYLIKVELDDNGISSLVLE